MHAWCEISCAAAQAQQGAHPPCMLARTFGAAQVLGSAGDTARADRGAGGSGEAAGATSKMSLPLGG